MVLKSIHRMRLFPLALLTGLLFFCIALRTVQATELINDGFMEGDAALFMGGFVAGEMGAARFQPAGPCPCFLSQVSFLYGGASGIRTVIVRVYEDGALTPDPGPQIYAGEFVVDGTANPLYIANLSGAGIFVSGPFRVAIEFLDDGAPSIAADFDFTIQPDTNFIFLDNGTWVESGTEGLLGDWIIRATIEEQASPANELKNDSWPASLVAHFQEGFVAGESAAVRLVPPGPCPCTVGAVSVLIGGAPGTGDFGLRIWDDSGLTDDPGALLFSKDMTLDSANATINFIPLLEEEAVVVDGPFRLGFEMLNPGLPSVARDDNGITPDVNFIDEDIQGWVEASSLSVAGDWIMRAVVTDQNAASAVLGYDDWNDLALPAFQDGFAADEIAAVRLDPGGICPCRVTRVRLMFGGDSSDTAVDLHIWDDNGALAPGALLYSSAKVLTPNDAALTVIDLPAPGVLVNGPFRVGIEFGQAGVPSVARDHDGIVPGLNFIYDDAPAWLDATTPGVDGDWIIRASVVPEMLFNNGFE
jgi:hypothetical protein